MAREWWSLRYRRAFQGFAGLLCVAGCHGTERDDSFGSLDAKTRQMLLAPAGGSLKTPERQYAITHPNATGATGVTPQNAFNRGMIAAQPTYTAMNDPNAQNNPVAVPATTGVVPAGYANTPNTTGVVPANYTVNPNTTGAMPQMISAPHMPNNPATMPLQPRVAQMPTPAPNPPPALPPVMPTPSAPAAPPQVTVVGTVAPSSEFTQPPVPTPIAVAAPSMPAPTPPVAPAVPAGTLTTLLSPVEQPPAGLGPIPPASLK